MYRPLTNPPTWATGAVSEGHKAGHLDMAKTPNPKGCLITDGKVSPFISQVGRRDASPCRLLGARLESQRDAARAPRSRSRSFARSPPRCRPRLLSPPRCHPQTITELGYNLVPSLASGNRAMMLLEGKAGWYIRDTGGFALWDTSGPQACLEAYGGTMSKLPQVRRATRRASSRRRARSRPCLTVLVCWLRCFRALARAALPPCPPCPPSRRHSSCTTRHSSRTSTCAPSTTSTSSRAASPSRSPTPRTSRSSRAACLSSPRSSRSSHVRRAPSDPSAAPSPRIRG